LTNQDRRTVYGSQDFVEKMGKDHKIEAVIKPQGRRVKSEKDNK
jgi:hypothetical protein